MDQNKVMRTAVFLKKKTAVHVLPDVRTAYHFRARALVYLEKHWQMQGYQQGEKHEKTTYKRF